MLSLRIKRFVLAIALAVMPLQGIAATLTVLLCHGDAQVHEMHAAGHHNHDDHASAHSDQHGVSAQDENGAASNSASYHLCCNLTASAPASVSIDTVLPDFEARAFVPAPLHDLFVPDQPQRPPLV